MCYGRPPGHGGPTTSPALMGLSNPRSGDTTQPHLRGAELLTPGRPFLMHLCPWSLPSLPPRFPSRDPLGEGCSQPNQAPLLQAQADHRLMNHTIQYPPRRAPRPTNTASPDGERGPGQPRLHRAPPASAPTFGFTIRSTSSSSLRTIQSQSWAASLMVSRRGRVIWTAVSSYLQARLGPRVWPGRSRMRTSLRRLMLPFTPSLLGSGLVATVLID